jgi:beta-N-acetylhexosaminidase
VDQEGGRVARFKQPLTVWPPAATLGRADDKGPDLAARFARALALEVAALGVSIDFLPVLDVLTTPNNPAIGDRALSNEPRVVAELGAAIIRELQANGVAACGKHFPGHGDTRVDSHLDLPLVEHPPDRFDAIEFVPFRAAIDADVAAIMTAHLLVPSLDESGPATLSPRIVEGILRGDLGFEGLVFTDDLEMKAITGRMTTEAAFVRAIAAGCDVGLLCGTDCERHAAAIEGLIRAVEREEIPWPRIEAALRRQQRTKARFASMAPIADPVSRQSLVPPLGRDWRPLPSASLRAVLGRDEHQFIAEEMRGYL